MTTYNHEVGIVPENFGTSHTIVLSAFAQGHFYFRQEFILVNILHFKRKKNQTWTTGMVNKIN